MIEVLKKLSAQQNLTTAEVEHTIGFLLRGENDIQASAFLALLHAKGETDAEILGVIKAMRQHMLSVEMPTPVLDIVGTGGDGFNTINISTGSALLASSCGVKIAKHGNRSVSSLSGSADVLEALGFDLSLSPTQAQHQVAEYHFTFLFAPQYHPVMAKVKALRKQLGLPSVFNLVGPLLNPAKAEYMMIGVANPALLSIFAKVAQAIGVRRAMIFHCQGLDEICPVGEVSVVEVNGNILKAYTFDAQDYGMARCSIEDLQGGDAEVNAEILCRALSGESSAIADTLVLNAGIALHLYGLASSIAEGIEKASVAQKSGQAMMTIKALIGDKHHA